MIERLVWASGQRGQAYRDASGRYVAASEIDAAALGRVELQLRDWGLVRGRPPTVICAPRVHVIRAGMLVEQRRAVLGFT